MTAERLCGQQFHSSYAPQTRETSWYVICLGLFDLPIYSRNTKLSSFFLYSRIETKTII